MTTRAYNFSPGPAFLPTEVVEIVRDNLLSYQGTGIGVMEMSHRSKHFEEIISTCETTLRKLLNIPASYAVLFSTGGATTQFSTIAMSFLKSGLVGNYIITGMWAEKAIEEAKKFGEVHVSASSADRNHCYIPSSLSLSENPAYLHFTSNNTIFGTQFKSEPDSKGVPLICDASSDLCSRPLEISKYGLIYAGAQKNLGPAGVTLVIIRKDLLDLIPKGLPLLSDYRTLEKNKSLYNTPPTFPIYVMGEVFKWQERRGGLSAINKYNEEKAGILYSAIDNNNLYEGHAEPAHRSLMNVTFRLKKPELDKTFLEEATAIGMSELQGHRSVGGMRASIYNAFPREGVEKLAEFMCTFSKKHG